MALVSIRGYARHKGVADNAVRRAIKRGVLRKSVTGKGRGIKIDSELADKEWPSHRATIKRKSTPLLTKALEQPLPAELPTGVQSPEIEKEKEVERDPYYAGRGSAAVTNARLLELKLAREEGRLVDAEEVRKEWVGIASQTRTKVLAVPSKMKQRCVEFSHEHCSILEDILREVLEELADTNETQMQGVG